MRLVRFMAEGCTGYGVYREDGVYPVSWEPYDYLVDTVEIVEPGSVTFLSPVVPSKIICVGLNYSDHAEELGMEVPAEPVLFMKGSNTVLDPGGVVLYPEQSGRVDYEGELAVVMGSETRSVSEGEALSHVLGYTCGLDMTARDLQARDGQWTRAKNFDTFCPLGPWVETEVDPSDLEITCRRNGEVVQSSRTSRMVFAVPALVSFISNVMTLYSGDIIMTGTPPGVGEVSRGDRLEVTIEGIGALECSIEGSAWT
jgi:2-keto-4-pentenoate hydratase/2-oxohepta-3-ene-1,7-dioic acid hydratase in catechol pathway